MARSGIAAVMALALGGAAIASAAPETATTTAAGKPQIGNWGFDLSAMDRSVAPGDSFQYFASGTWIRTAKIPSDKAQVDTFSTLEELSQKRTRAILEEAAKTPGAAIGDFYASYSDRAAINALGFAPARPIMARIDAASTPGQLATLLAELSRANVNLPAATVVDSDDKDPTRVIPAMGQSGIGMPEREYYLDDDPGVVEIRNAYLTYLTRLLTLAGEGNAAARARAVLALETQIAQAHWTQVDSRNPDKTYNKVTPADLKKAAPTFDWDTYLREVGVGGERELIVRQPSAIAKTAELLATTPRLLLRDYLKLQVLGTYAPYMSDAFVDANFDYVGRALSGVTENQPVWKRASDLVSSQMGEAVGKVYVERHFPPEAKAEADRLVKNVIAAWDRRIQNLQWMSPETRTRARAKLAALTPEIGYPRKWRDYSTLEIKRDDLFGNVWRANRFEHQRHMNKLGKPVDRTEWYTIMPPQAVNGYANHKWNQIVFSAGVLQPPFFDPNADPAVNYGAMAAVIAHEIGHHFDDQGAKYDQNGVLRTWWTNEDVKRFEGLQQKLVDQYDKYEVFPGKFVNGRLTIGDNIGDLAGVTVAYDAYKASDESKNAPVLDGFTGDQRFFLAWAQVWRSIFRKEAMLQRLQTDVHAPPEFRTAVVRNVDGWQDAFGVKPGQKLYLAPEDRVRIW